MAPRAQNPLVEEDAAVRSFQELDGRAIADAGKTIEMEGEGDPSALLAGGPLCRLETAGFFEFLDQEGHPLGDLEFGFGLLERAPERGLQSRNHRLSPQGGFKSRIGFVGIDVSHPSVGGRHHFREARTTEKANEGWGQGAHEIDYTSAPGKPRGPKIVGKMRKD